ARRSPRDRGAAGRAPGVGAPVSAGRGMIPEDLTRILFVTDPQISPDGRRVAFVVTSLSEERDEYLANIWIVGVEGGTPRRFTAGPRRDIEPRWSPDGTRLAFLSERAPRDKLQLYVLPADGGEPTKLTALEHGVSSIAWTPDGNLIAADPVWAPDGESIVFASARHAARDDDDASDLWRVPAKGGAPQRLTATTGPVMLPAFAPDGRTIAFLARAGLNAYGRNVQLFTVPADGGQAVCLTSALDRSCG